MNLFERYLKDKKFKQDDSKETEGNSENKLIKKLEKDTELDFFQKKTVPDVSLEEIVEETRLILSEIESTDIIQISYKTASDLLEQSEERISTGVFSIDKLLGGGLEPQSITEFYGPSSAGKTQLTFQIVCDFLSSHDDYVIFIDTEGTFKPNRILEILKAYEIFSPEILKRILVFRVFNVSNQITLLKKINDLINEFSVGLLLIDSLTALFRSEFITPSALLKRQQLLNKYINNLQKLAFDAHLPIVVTNQVTRIPNTNEIMHVGGNIVAHGITHRIVLVKDESVTLAKVVGSPNLPETTATFKITPNGILSSF